jgi:hypothetical protein
MACPTLIADPRPGRRPGIVLLTTLVLAFMGAMAPQASATIEIQNYNDPAGDPTRITYGMFAGGPEPLIPDFVLGDGETTSFGPDPNRYGRSYTFQALPPAGWRVADIRCASTSGPGTFAYDIANGRVTITHDVGEDHFCAFTNRKTSSSGSGGGSVGTAGGSPGFSPTTPGTLPGSRSKAPALLRVRGGRRFAKATIRIARKSVIKLQLRKGKRVVGTTRVTRKAGTHVVKVALRKKWRLRYQRQGRKRVTFNLRVVVVGNNRATKVFHSGVIVRL